MSLITTLAATAPSSDVVIHAGLLDWTSTTASDLQGVLRVVAVTVAIVFVVYKAVQSKFAIGTIVLSALAAGVFIWLVFNVTDVSDTISEDLPGSAPSSAYVDVG